MNFPRFYSQTLWFLFGQQVTWPLSAAETRTIRAMTRDEDCYHDFNLECSLSEVFVQHVVFFIHCKNSEHINTLRVSFHVHTDQNHSVRHVQDTSERITISRADFRTWGQGCPVWYFSSFTLIKLWLSELFFSFLQSSHKETEILKIKTIKKQLNHMQKFDHAC